MIRLLRHYFLSVAVFPLFRQHHFFKLFGHQYCVGPDRFGWKDGDGYRFYISNALRQTIADVPDWKNN